MFLNYIIILTILITLFFLWSRTIRHSVTWQAMTTPLASIIGSGFLVLGPILNSAYGRYAPMVMAALCLGAYLYGAAIRYNMTAIEKRGDRHKEINGPLEVLAEWSLGFAYIISVAYYLNLFGAFGLSLTPFDNPTNAKILTTVVFVAIFLVGWTRGFKALERMEYVSVAAKLAIIAGLLVGLITYFYGRATDGNLLSSMPELTGWPAMTLAFGLLVTVQGFETSRYLGDEYDSNTRCRSMRRAQWLSTAIYMIYILLLAYVFDAKNIVLSETAVIDMMKVVAPVLPFLLVAAALAAQFSAAVADTSGSGGLISELTRGTVTPRMAYGLLAFAGIILTWSANIFEIISYASRAFAFYYAIQAAIASVTAWHIFNHKHKSLLFAILSGLGLLIVVFAQPIEG